jgi:hypothetical protein
MSNVQTTRDGARPQESAFRKPSSVRVPELRTFKDWHWHDPPVLFPICLGLQILGYAVVRIPQ